MKYKILSALTVAAIVGSSTSWTRAEDPAPKGKIRVLLTSGGHGFDAKSFYGMFDAMPDVQYTKASMPKDGALLKPDLRKDYDVLVMYDRIAGITPQQQQDFVALLKQGIGVVSLHHNLASHRDWDEFTKIVGGKYLYVTRKYGPKSYGPSEWKEGVDINVFVADKAHPVTRGLADFKVHDEVYRNYYVAPEAHVLLKTDHPLNNPELAWTTKYGASRVVYIQLGHGPGAHNDPNYRKLVNQAIEWVAGRRF